MKKPLVSIILRSFNEERWIGSCLDAIYSQTFLDFEVILVDNNSTDKTVEKASKYPVKIVTIEKFLPGRALNLGIENSTGKYFVCMSGHCIPTNKHWLENFVKNFDNSDPMLAAVYGRQEPLSFTPATDKRDLITVFGLDRKIQYKDTFFHNANSIIRRDLWDEVPFDDHITNIEDRLWAKVILSKGYHIAYDPSPSVYHYHGIHQNQNEERLRNVVRIIGDLHKEDNQFQNKIDINSLNIVALIPVKGEVLKVKDIPLISYTIRQARKSKHIKKIILLTDNEEYLAIAKQEGAEVPFLRDQTLSEDYIELSQVYQDSLDKLESLGIFPDLIVPLEMTFPFRSPGTLDDMIEKLVYEGFDSVLAVREEYSSTWKKDGEDYVLLDEGFVPRKFKEPLYVSVKGIGIVTYPIFLRQGSLLGSKLGMYNLADPKSAIEVRDAIGLMVAEKLLET